MFTCEEIKAKVVDLKATIAAYEAASVQLATDQIASYSFNTGQTVQSVTKMDVDKLDGIIDRLYNRLSVLYNRFPDCTGSAGGVVIARPGW